MNGFKASRTLAAALFVSVAVNLFLGGWLVTQAFGPYDEQRAHGPRFDRESARAAVSDTGRETVDRIWDARRSDMRETLEEVRQARLDMGEAFTAEPFDEARLRDALDRMQTYSVQSRERLHAAILETARSLSAEDRRRYFEAGTSKSRKYLRAEGGGPNAER